MLTPTQLIRIKTDAQVTDCTWSQFCADNADGFSPAQLDAIGAAIFTNCEVDVSEYMHCGSACTVYSLIKGACGCEVEGVTIKSCPACAIKYADPVQASMDAEAAAWAKRQPYCQMNTD